MIRNYYGTACKNYDCGKVVFTGETAFKTPQKNKKMNEKMSENTTLLKKYLENKMLGKILQSRKMFTKTIHAKHWCWNAFKNMSINFQ